jgi:DKNYY family
VDDVPEDYRKENGVLYWCNTQIKGADYETFERLSDLWAADRQHVFSYGRKVRGADRATFRVLNPLFAKDSQRVYFPTGTIDADAASFEVLDEGCFETTFGDDAYAGYARDAHNIYYYTLTIGKPHLVKSADASTFRTLKFEYGTDGKHIFFEGYKVPKADPSTFRILAHWYACDATHVYFTKQIITGADPNSFEIEDPSKLLSRDRAHRYDRWEILQ